MKKSIFSLSYKEGKKIDSEADKTSFCQQYKNGYLVFMCILLILGGGTLDGLYLADAPVTAIIIGTILIIGFSSLLFLIFWFKRFDLVKQYYEEKITENKTK